jgi:hypothetical protein
MSLRGLVVRDGKEKTRRGKKLREEKRREKREDKGKQLLLRFRKKVCAGRPMQFTFPPSLISRKHAPLGFCRGGP